MSEDDTIHASAVAIDGRGILIRGRSGSGKSALVLGLIDRDPATTRLVADDRVILALEDGRLTATAPASLAGKLEVRGIGIVEMAALSSCPVALVVDIAAPAECARLPEAESLTVMLHGVAVPRLMLPAGATDGPARVRFALVHLARGKVS